MAQCMKGVHLKRLGEAVHGLAAFAPGQTGWVFVSRRDPKKVEYALTEEEADRVRKDHAQSGDEWLEVEFCGRARPRQDKTGYTITVEADNGADPVEFRAGFPKADQEGGTATKPDGTWIDAIFFTRSAVEKFVIPYYASLYGAEAARSMLERYDEVPEGQNVAVHGTLTILTFEEMDEMAPEGFVNVDEFASRALG